MAKNKNWEVEVEVLHGKRNHSLHKNKRPARLVLGVQNGERLTRKQWAEKLDTSIQGVDMILRSLRKRNYMFYPVGGESFKSKGVIKDVVNTKNDFRSTYNRISRNYTNPHIVRTFSLLENVYLKDPKNFNEIELKATNLLMIVMEKKQQLLSAPANSKRK